MLKTLFLTGCGCVAIFILIASAMRVEADKAMQEAREAEVAKPVSTSASNVIVDGHLIKRYNTAQDN